MDEEKIFAGIVKKLVGNENFVCKMRIALARQPPRVPRDHDFSKVPNIHPIVCDISAKQSDPNVAAYRQFFKQVEVEFCGRLLFLHLTSVFVYWSSVCVYVYFFLLIFLSAFIYLSICFLFVFVFVFVFVLP